GGNRKDRAKGIEGLTLAGLLMFGNGLVVRDVFDNIFMDFRDESHKTDDVRWNNRITYDGTWENNVFNFLGKVLPKLTAELPKPFKLKGYVREDDTPLHKAVREACVNMIIHADYMLEGTLKVIKTAEGFEITNPGVLKIPKEQIFQGGNSKARNPRMQSMFRMVGYGDNVGSGFPTILNAWEEQGWEMPDLLEQGKIEATGSTKGKMYRKC
ncbi:MAG: AAA family ATPase, partial [Lachnospiraceae bacterium]|nr:AAA family ATPase [Lachnospiraceae bacterium]